MGRAMSNRNFCAMKHEVAEFDGEWLASIGRPELTGAWTIFGHSGVGKTSFTIKLCKYLCRFGRTAYCSLEQGFGGSFGVQWARENMAEEGSKVIILDEKLHEIADRLRKRKAPRIVIIDTVTRMSELTNKAFNKLMEEFKKTTLFVFVAHEDSGKASPARAEYIRTQSDVKIHIVGFRAFFTTRYAEGEGVGGAPMVIWQQGADIYWANKEITDKSK